MKPVIYLLIIGIIMLVTIVVAVVVAVIVNKSSKSEFNRSIKSDISIEQMRDLEERFARFLVKNNLPVGSSIETIAATLKIISGEECNIADQAQIDISEKKEGYKQVNYQRGLAEETKRFVFAHECAHIINGDSVPQTRPDTIHKNITEQRADYTAAAILMPIEKVYEYLKDCNYLNLSKHKKIQIVKELCVDYGVSEIIVLRRIKEIYSLKEEVCASLA